MIDVLVVEDSPVVREFLLHILGSDPEVRVIGTAHDGEEALDAMNRLKPHVITMDIHMPRMNGLEATRRIMETTPVPIVIVSGSDNPREMVNTFDAMEAGAVAMLKRPAGLGHPDYEATARELVRTVKAMAEVKVIRRWPKAPNGIPARLPTAMTALEATRSRIVAIGASTGGPPALQTILAALPGDFPLPIAIVQHMTAGFSQGFIEWLGHSSALPVQLGMHGDPLQPGRVYLAPDEHHMTVTRGGRIALNRDAPENGLRPAVSCLFRSVAENYGSDAIAGLLTGMGRDGAEELRLLKERGAITFAQDKESSVVHGMPGEAICLNAAMLVLPPGKIAAVLADLAKNGHALQEMS